MDTKKLIQKLSSKISGISSNSKHIKPGYAFICLSEKSQEFIPEAIRLGAKFVITKSCSIAKNNKIIICSDPHELYHVLSSKLHNKHPNFIAAVTGTNGKTSVVDFCRQIWNLLAYKAASIGTLGTFVNQQLLYKNSLTTPDALKLHQILSELYDEQVQYLCLEASSHGIDQKRINSIIIKAAAFTNLSHDHLDYHHNMALYFSAKKKLFSHLVACDGYSILNMDTAEYTQLKKITKSSNVITYGTNKGDIQLLNFNSNKEGHHIKIKIYNTIYEKFFPILGQFQIYNLMCAIGIIIASNIKYKDLPIEKLVAPKGRMEKINDFIIIDYSHTPDALKNTLMSLKLHKYSNKIILVFGCGGNRDIQKRKIMGKIASQYTIKTVITDDNPRNEDPSKIRKDILSHCHNAIEVPNRKEAIKYAIEQAISHNYIVLITGKGHEDYQIIGNNIVNFNDEIIAKSIINQLYK
ncbi:UDP-N-acetylmuramoyl-L-alanyl-D-glutamate--2,6-diaminopimelate ligase [Neoehrlichia mikurensis]|uniref:UDP-N-acetylmuramoyl-L-alanyl-D-glutamate--2,6-diaminopimelate ligase n=1 Tax=Neoehrlichia mikurensis TaxID=89586 RepID=A0A9Q9F356_9RICK|nr:UDP-N-acetylmuramoyl-L-alanyl-D-glutamate--2,6-diaminopimelate ligase [Neoehrlichia mikurensis]QXK92152.1 UDP-N-acetylmuramoyl-L-alanyl-D-glutamate--2,6-diaminopimelate ligase [Neoehrlichia mikurensis]QXK92609.1 UDP-N-acetylmuramoyl-L-alanyl-D-glutamate--2,6-diaminopimelate ligase [Neoehrlichia mikurensis]QXK93846.1 UDP-N-acetylmuramoyl-L-alanyl-D-glutamate--2,6-diaminopimelate ligase [Neoehrlichia mikurensis]UTO55159.1 UDP-N-acetylmuramoyl-L-alanyl-D-glutamate--2,6-diaminopimelate ligase [N